MRIIYESDLKAKLDYHIYEAKKDNKTIRYIALNKQEYSEFCGAMSDYITMKQLNCKNYSLIYNNVLIVKEWELP